MSDTESSDESIEPQSPTTVNVIEEYDYIVEEKPKKEKVKKKKIEVLENLQEEVIKKAKPRGRPKKPLEEKLAKQIITKEKIIYMVQNDKGDYEKAKNPKITNRELKKIELNKQKELKEVELGKTLQTRKNGKIDNRSAKVRTPAQIEATRKLVEANKKRREDKTTHKKEVKKQIIKESVREVVNEPFYQPPAIVKPINPYEGMIF
jgi:hypothetical protein|tara:strand:- start:5809 stop:6426 length:618 start_codon:yes stop_codon:yes gene_type:complete